MVTTEELAEDDPGLVAAVQAGLQRGSELAVDDPDAALDALLGAIDGIDPPTQVAEMQALSEADAFAAGVEPGSFEPERAMNWVDFAIENGIEIPRTPPEIVDLLGG